MKFNRTALVAAVLALGVAACGDDVEIVQPTPEPPPPPPPVTATMAPASASVAVGNSVVFAVNASGGVAGDAASWTCASSNTGIATVTSTSAGCSATGVAAGDVTITASVTKSGETVNVGAQLTVTSDEEPPAPPGDPAFILIQSITGAGDSDVSGLNGRVSVQVGVERGDQELEELSVLLDGAVVASQSFGGGMDMGMTSPEEAAEQAVHVFTLSFDSDGYDDHGHPDYANGEHTISAELEIGVTMADGMHGHETISSNAINVEFKNSNFIATTISGLGDGAMNATTGRVWHGGPDASSIEISALPVLYSGSVSSVTLNQFCGADSQTDSEAPFSFEITCKSYMTAADGGDAPTFNVGGTMMTAKGSKVYLDYMAPDAPDFVPDPNDREDGWVNASVNFTGENGESSSKKDGWLDYNNTNAGDGVGGYTPRLRYALAPSNNKVSTAIAADPVTAVVLPPGVSGATKENALCVVVSAVDLLGNESKLPAADKNCVSADDYDADEADMSAGLLAGVDVDAPTIKFSPASPKANDTSLKEFQVQAADAGSGIRTETKSVVAEASRRDAKETKKLSDLEVDISLPLATTRDIESGVGYYTFTAHTVDKAGNASEKITRTALHDDEDPVGGIIVGSFDGKTGRYSLTATVTDDLSIKEYWAETTFADITGSGLTVTGGPFRAREGTVTVDAYNADDLTQSKLESPYMVHTYRFLQTGPTAATALTGIRVVARDHGANADTILHTFDPALTAPATVADGLLDLAPTAIDAPDQAASPDQAFPDSAYTVFDSMSVAAASKSGGTVELTATVSGPLFVKPLITTPFSDNDTPDDTTDDTAQVLGQATEGLRDNPLTRVDFYAVVAGTTDGTTADALKYIGSASGGSAGADDYDGDPAAGDGSNDRRRYIYQLEMSKADFLANVGVDDDFGVAEADGATDITVEANEGAILAFGVRDNTGVAVQLGVSDLFVKE